MYHTIEDLCKKVDVIKMKTDALRDRQQERHLAELPLSEAEINFELADIQALCRDIANDYEK